MLKKLFLVFGFIAAIVITAEIAALLVMKSSVQRYANYWQARNKETTPQNAFIYVALGDSTAQGIGATSAGRGYVGLIAKDLEAKLKRPVQVINLSQTGAKTDDVLQRQLPELQRRNLKPDLVTMQIGANNLLDYDASAFRNHYQAILRQLPAGKTVISDMPYFGGRVDAHGNDVAASQIVREAAKDSNIPVAPLYDSLKTHHSLRIYAADYFHPSNHGYTIWRDAFMHEIRSILNP